MRAALERSLTALLLAALCSCAPSGDGATGGGTTASRPNILLVVVDTLRADHLSAYGYARETSPAMDAIAARGVRFTQHRAQAPCTFPSVNSLLTSQPVERFFGQPTGDLRIPANVTTVAERLRDAGYVTAAFSASPIVRARPTNFNRTGGFERGFALFDEECLWKDARCLNRRALAALARHQSGEPVFLYVHYLDPHGPYQPPKKTRRSFARPGSGRNFPPDVRDGESFRAAARIDRGEPAGVGPAEIAHWIDLYDDEIAWVDRHIGELVETFEKTAPPLGTLVVIAADHGESFLEHGTLAHCRTLFDSEIRTPLILAGPGVPQGAVRDSLSENLDLVPSLLDLAGLPLPAGELAGRSLRPTIVDGRALPKRMQTSTFSGWYAAVEGHHKLMVKPRAAQLRLFDLARDPMEQQDLAATQRRLAASMRRALAAQNRAAAGFGDGDDGSETERQLRALGYL